MKFCGIKVNSLFFLAPMAAITSLPFRLLCKKQGAGLTITEQINATQIAKNPDPFTNNEFFVIKTVKEEKPVGVQLFGTEEKDFIKAVDLVEKNFDLININCGCPAQRETSVGAGAAMLKKPEKIASVLSAIKSVTDKPVSAKIRLGWNKNDSLKIVKDIGKSGVDSIMVHGRTAEQKYSGEADWGAIKEIQRNSGAVIVANGDIDSGEKGKQILEKTGCKFGMVGREAMRNPFIFREINEALNGKDWCPGNEDRINAFFDYYGYCKRFEMIKIGDLKLKAVQLTKGIEFTKQHRMDLMKAQNYEEIERILLDFKEKLKNY